MKRLSFVAAAAGTVLALGLTAARAEAQGHPMGGMAGQQGMSHQGMTQQGMSTAMMAQMQTMMQRTDLMMKRTQQMTQFAQTMPMEAPGAHAMHQMTEHFSAMSGQMRGLTSQMHDLMMDEKLMASGMMRGEMGTMQKSLTDMMGNMDRMLKSMEKMQQGVPTPPKP